MTQQSDLVKFIILDYIRTIEHHDFTQIDLEVMVSKIMAVINEH